MKNFNKKVVLVTGGAGFIGSHIVDALIKQGSNVVVLDDLSTGKKENINPKATFYQADIGTSKVSDIFKKEKPEVVFHFAAHIEARESVKDPIFDAKANILGSLNVLENCRKFGVKKIIFASSGGEIYGDAKVIPTPEDCQPSPISPYGVSKLATEKYLYSYFKMHGISFSILRYGNVYGPRQNPYGESGVIAIFLNKMLHAKIPFIHGSGKQTKDYIFIEDAVSATIAACKKNINGVINIATGKETSVVEIFNKLKKLTGYKKDAKHIPLPTGVLKRGVLSIAKAKKVIGFEPQYNVDKGFALTVRWFKNRYEKN